MLCVCCACLMRDKQKTNCVSTTKCVVLALLFNKEFPFDQYFTDLIQGSKAIKKMTPFCTFFFLYSRRPLNFCFLFSKVSNLSL